MAQLGHPAARIDDALDVALTLKAGTGPSSMQTAPAAFPLVPAGTRVHLTNGTTTVAGLDGFDIPAAFVGGADGSTVPVAFLAADGAWHFSDVKKGSLAAGAGNFPYPPGIPTGDYEIYNYAGSTASGQASQAWGANTVASGARAHSSGFNTVASGASSDAGGQNVTASGAQSFGRGFWSKALAAFSVGTGYFGRARVSGSRAHGGGFQMTTGNYPSFSYYYSQVAEHQLARNVTGGAGTYALFATENPGDADSVRYLTVEPNTHGRCAGQVTVLNVSTGAVQTGALSFGFKRGTAGNVSVQNAVVAWEGGITAEGTLAVAANGLARVDLNYTSPDGTPRLCHAELRVLEVGPRP